MAARAGTTKAPDAAGGPDETGVKLRDVRSFFARNGETFRDSTVSLTTHQLKGQPSSPTVMQKPTASTSSLADLATPTTAIRLDSAS